MPAYSSTTAAVAIYPGDQVALVNDAASDSDVTKTMRVSLAQVSGNSPTLTLINTTNEDVLAVEVAAVDAEADYVVLSDIATAIAPAQATAATFSSTGPWLRCTFTTAPSSGSLIICR